MSFYYNYFSSIVSAQNNCHRHLSSLKFLEIYLCIRIKKCYFVPCIF